MLQRLGIRGKLLAAVAVPTIVLLLAASFVVLNAATAYTNGRNVTQLVALAGNGAPLITSLQDERAEVSSYLRAISDGQADRGNARTNVNTAVASLRAAGQEDPSFAPAAEQIAAAISGANGQEGLESLRAMSAEEPVEGEFPTWPDATQTQTLSETFESVAAEVAEIAKVLPQNDAGTIARGLPGLIRAEGRTTKALLDDARTSAEALPDLIRTTDRSGTSVIRDAESLAGNSTNDVVLQFLGEASSGLQGLTDIRDSVRAGTVQPGPADAAYTAVIANLLAAAGEVANITGDRELSNGIKAYVAMGELVEAVRSEEVYVKRKVAQGSWRLGETVQYQAFYFGSNNALAKAKAAVSLLPGVPQVPDFGVSYDPANRNGFETIRDRVINDPTNRALIDQRQNEWPLQVDEEVEAYNPTLAGLLGELTSRSAAIERNSLIQTLATALVAAIAVSASIFAALAISRRIVNPLRRLTTTATAVRQELPRLVERVAMPGQTVDVSEVQIPVESQDEVGRLAEAFNSVNAATLAIAAEQAALRGSISEMFVNVARRDQVLLNRQLASIDEMERTEDNQGTLTKLFALDHLATRMRRNSESLLVLAGIDTGRRLRRPMPLSDVIRTASSEIELYERIQLELDADPAMLGHSALTAAHLFAELLENATVFSDPGTQVVVRTMERDGAFVVSVLDRGIGMTSTELAEANARVASTAASEILGAQRLGLFVVGRIARRIGARVYLESAEGRGTEATVVMSPSLFDPSLSHTQGHSSPSTKDDVIHAPAALVHHQPRAEEIVAPEVSSRGMSAYQPTVIEDGASLSGRPGDAPEPLPQPAALAPRGVPEPAASRGIEQLLAADSAAAPAAVAFDLEEFTEGITDVGLPTRRRRASAGPESAQDTNSIIALPQRASDEQLSALQSATTSGFTPILAADEVSPESAEARARVFRGFRTLRGMEAESGTLPADAESLGHALRRGMPLSDAAAADGDLTSVPAMEPDEQAPQVGSPTGSVPTVRSEQGQGSFEPDVNARDQASEVMRNFAADQAGRKGTPQPPMRQSPLIMAGYVEEGGQGAPESQDGDLRGAGMLVPQLEEDDEPVLAAPVPQDRPTVDDRWERPNEGAGVDAVSLDDAPVGSGAYASAPAQPQAEAVRSPLYPVVSNPWQQQVPPEAQAYAEPAAANPWAQQAPQAPQSAPAARPVREAQFEADPVASVPSLDDLIMQGGTGSHGDDRSGFFSRLFGKQGKGGHMDGSTAPSNATQGSPTDFLNANPASSWSQPVPAPERYVAPEVTQFYQEDQVQEAAPQQRWAATEETPSRESFGAAYSQPAPEHAPVLDRSPYGSASVETPVAHDDRAPRWNTLPAMSQQEPTQYTVSPGFDKAPSDPAQDFARFDSPSRYDMPFGQPSQHGTPGVFAQEDHGMVYSPDQLARPLGWETAGASALQAAAPESAVEYRPVVQISPDANSSGQEDYASSVFSELSSLASERPKVETTRAGLAKRTPVPLEEVSEAPVATVASAPRDAEAVRSRFSAFYSGTQRARDDVHDFNESTQGSLTEP